MRLINSSFEILEQGPGLQGLYKQIELAGRTCYKSLDKITEDSAEGFVNRMIASKHYAMLEHGTVYLKIPKDKIYRDAAFIINEPAPYTRNLYYKTWWSEDYKYVTTNYRYIIENKLEHWLQFLCEPTEFHEKRVTVRFTTDRGVSHEFVRHRVFSFAQESTRYCNYSKDKFGNEITFIIPSWCANQDEIQVIPNKYDVEWDDELRTDFGDQQGQLYVALAQAESNYFRLLDFGWTPQQARQVLPNALKTELVMTGFISDWDHFFDLRARGTTGAPHPDAKTLAEPLMHEFENRNLI